jgi:hypothetical protein
MWLGHGSRSELTEDSRTARSCWEQDRTIGRVCVRKSGRPRRKKPRSCEMRCDVPGTWPDPSLGSQPRDRDPATRLLGASPPAGFFGCGYLWPAWFQAMAAGLHTNDRRFRDDRSIPATRPTQTSCSGCTGFGGDRVHRGEPLLLGVDKEYQISLRLFDRAA